MIYLIVFLSILLIGVVLTAVWIRRKGPATSTLIKSGLKYRINGTPKKLGDFNVRNKIYLIKEDVLDDFYDLIKYSDYILQKHNIPYTAAFGTLLGTIRHGGIMPWDDDADIYVNVDNSKYDEIVESIRAEMNKDGYEVKKNYNANYYQLAKIDSKLHFPYIDWYKYWNRYGNDDLLFPIKRVPFEDFEINIPNKPLECIDVIFNSTGKNDPLNDIVHDVVLNRYYSLWVVQQLKKLPWLHHAMEKITKVFVKI
ncbi:MAG: LicD family protein [Cyclobacteriaceae bacterium]